MRGAQSGRWGNCDGLASVKGIMVRLRRWSILLAAALAAACTSATHPPGRPSAPALSVVAHSGTGVEVVADIKPPAAKPDPPLVAAIATAEQGFGLRLLSRASGSHPTGNLTVSPLSLDLALTMLENGAGGATLTEISRALEAGSLDVPRQDQAWAALMTTLDSQSTTDQISLDSANSLWLQKNLPMQAQFMSDLARYFDSGVWQVDLAHGPDQANAAINTWVAHQTHGKITQLFGAGDLTRYTALVLANAVYFHAGWQTPFDPASSYRGPFYLTGNRVGTTRFMNGPAPYVASTAKYAVARLPYTGGGYEADVIMPAGESLHAFAATLTTQRLASIIASASGPGQVRLPGFTSSSYLNLNTILKSMGMPTAFTAAADFSAMSTVSLEVQSVVQRDYVSVGEKGTEAAAATGVSMVPTSVEVSPGARVTFDHPFLFLVRNVGTGTLLFVGLVNNPGD